MENIPIPRPTLPCSTDLSNSTHKSTRNPKSSQGYKLQGGALNNLNLSPHALNKEQHSEIKAQIQPKQRVEKQATNSKTSYTDYMVPKGSLRQLPTPPPSHQLGNMDSSQGSNSASPPFDVFDAPVAEPSSQRRIVPATARKRTRPTPAVPLAPFGNDSIATASPNPKARKQARTLPSSTQPKSTTNNQDVFSAQEPPQSRQSRSTSHATKPTTTPLRKTAPKRAPKTEKPAAKRRVASATQRSRRKSTPLRSSRGPPIIDLTSLPSPESPSDDPLLLVGTEEWIRVPWKPVYFKKDEDTDPKIEEEDVELNQSVMSIPDDEARRPETISEDLSMHLESLPPLDPQESADAGWQDSGSNQDEDEFRFADSSFAGRDLDIGDVYSKDFTIPLRLNSPPARKRRTSAVAQRRPTPSRLSPNHSVSNSSDTSPPPRALDSLPDNEKSPRLPAARSHSSRTTRGVHSGSPEGPLAPFATSTPFGKRSTRTPSLSLREGEGYVFDPRGFQVMEEVEDVEQGRDHDMDTSEEESGSSLETRLKTAAQHAGRIITRDSKSNPGHGADRQPQGRHLENTDDTLEGSASSKPVPASGSTNLSALASQNITDADDDYEDEAQSMQIERELTVDLQDDEMGSYQPSYTMSVTEDYLEPVKDEDEDDHQLLPHDLSSVTFHPSQSGSASGVIRLHSTDDKRKRNESAADDDDSAWEDDADSEPIVEISSRDPKVAARAAAILKLHHDYIEDGLRSSYARRRTSSLSGFDSPVPQQRFATPVQDPGSRSRRPSVTTPVHPSLLREAEMEVIGTPPSAARYRVETPEAAGGTKFAALNAKYATPPAPKIPIVIIDPASTRPEDRFLSLNGEKVWKKENWKHLEKCLLKERNALAKAKGVDSEDVEMGDISLDKVVERFVDEEGLDEDELVDDWAREKLQRRCLALSIRYGGQSPAMSLSEQSMFVPLTPLPGHASNKLEWPVDHDNDTPTLSRQSSLTSTRGLPASLHAPGYAHLHREARAVKPPLKPLASLDLSSATEPDEHVSKPHASSSGPRPTKTRPKKPTSQIPVPSRAGPSKIEAAKGRQPKQVSQPPPADTPTTASRVLGFLGLGSILRTSAAKKVATKKSKKELMASPPQVVGFDSIKIRPRVPERRPLPAEDASSRSPSVSKEDLNHTETQPPLPMPQLIPPKELVELHPVPPPPPQPQGRTRTVSGTSVKELVQSFEELEDEKDRERQRITGIVSHGRRAISMERGGSAVPARGLRRMPSNLSTASVVNADDLE